MAKDNEPQKPSDTAIAAVIAFDRDFRFRMPREARTGSYDAKDSDRFATERYEIPDGRYRVYGSGWIVAFKDHRFVSAFEPKPPKFGGAGVIAIPALPPANG